MNRNINLIRTICLPTTGVPYTKPRFILKESELELINVPTVAPEKIIPILRDPDSWDLIKYESWFSRKGYKKNFLYQSKLFALAKYVADEFFQKTESSRAGSDRDPLYREKCQVTRKILQKFKDDVESSGGKFYIVFLPSKKELEELSQSRDLPNSAFLKHLGEEIPIIHPELEMLEKTDRTWRTSLFQGHYTPLGNQLVGAAVSEYILQHKKEFLNQIHEQNQAHP